MNESITSGEREREREREKEAAGVRVSYARVYYVVKSRTAGGGSRNKKGQLIPESKVTGCTFCTCRQVANEQMPAFRREAPISPTVSLLPGLVPECEPPNKFKKRHLPLQLRGEGHLIG